MVEHRTVICAGHGQCIERGVGSCVAGFGCVVEAVGLEDDTEPIEQRDALLVTRRRQRERMPQEPFSDDEPAEVLAAARDERNATDRGAPHTATAVRCVRGHGQLPMREFMSANTP